MSPLQSRLRSAQPSLSFFAPSLSRFARTCLPVAVTAAVILSISCGLAQPACAAVHEEWNRRWDGPTHQYDTAYQVAIDKAGNVFAAGYSDFDSGSTGDYRLVKYGPDGTELWNRRYDGPAHGMDILTGLALDAAGDAYVTGYSQKHAVDNQSFDYATLKYDPSGNLLWVRRYDGPAHGSDVANAIAVDSEGDAFVTGYSEIVKVPNGVSRVAYATLKYAPDGTLLWTNFYDGPSQYGSKAMSVAVDHAGNSYVTGYTLGQSGRVYFCTTIKYSLAGLPLWVRSVANGFGVALVVDSVGSVYVSSDDTFLVIKYDTNGNEVWRGLPAPGQPYVGPSALAVDSSGNALVTGYGGIVKYGSTGDFKWYRSNFHGSANGVAVDAEGNAYVAGYFFTPNNNLNFLLLKYGPDGHLHWRRDFDGPLSDTFIGLKPSNDSANAVAVDDLGNVYVVGASQPYIGSSDIRTIKYSQ